MSEYMISRPEPDSFGTMDPTDCDYVTFDWSQRVVATDQIVWAGVVSEPAGLVIGPAFTSGGLQVDAEVSAYLSTFRELPQTFMLRCTIFQASGDVGNWSIPLTIRNM